MQKNNKLIVILGPTACGKTKLAVKLAAKFNGEIISADSRQVYKGMDIGTGKDLKDYVVKKQEGITKKQTKSNCHSEFAKPDSRLKTQADGGRDSESGGKSKKILKQVQDDSSIKIPYHLINIVNPMIDFNVAKYQKLAYQAIDEVLKRGKMPFLVGGTGLYIKSITDGYVFSLNRKNIKLLNQIRKKLDKLSLEQLLARLKKIDPETYRIVDQKNRRRVQRALEIYYETDLPKSNRPANQKPPYDILIIGVKYPLDKIYQRIDRRLEERIKEGMVDEVKQLRQSGVTWKRLDGFGLEYRRVAEYLREYTPSALRASPPYKGEETSLDVMVEKLKNDIHHFAKRQLTWFKRDKSVKWVVNYSGANSLIKNFLKK